MSYTNYKLDRLIKKTQKMGAYPLDILIAGVTGAGKSTTTNALFGKTVARVGLSVDPETMQITPYRLNERLRIWDTPGLGDGKARDTKNSRAIVDTLYRDYSIDGDNRYYGIIDLALIIIEGANRDLGTTYKLLNEIIVPNIDPSRIIIATNQADLAMKGRHWNFKQSCPEHKLEKFLIDQSCSIQNRILEGSGILVDRPIFYSAEYGYNMDSLMDEIIQKVPSRKRILITS